MSKKLGVEQQMMHAYVALQILGAGRSINDLADELDLTRFTVSRMVKRAREDGLIEVRATIDVPVDVDLSGRLAERFGLRSALVVRTAVPDGPQVVAAIARTTAQYLSENVEEDDVLGMAPGRTLVAASRLIESMPHCDVVQLTGVGTARTEDGGEAVTNVGRVAGGGTYPLYAPLLAEGAAHELAGHPAVRQTLKRIAHVTKAVLTIGGWPDGSLLAQQLGQLGELDALLDQGVIGELGAVLLDAEGHAVPALEQRLIGVDEEQIRRVPTSIAVGGGAAKHVAVLATLRSGLCDVIITDVGSAEHALATE